MSTPTPRPLLRRADSRGLHRAGPRLRRTLEGEPRPLSPTTAAAPPAPRQIRAAGPTMLSVREVTVRFGGVVANDAVSLEVCKGQLTALIGPNGAGKTTLFNVVSGSVAPTSGRVLLAGRDVTGMSRRALAQRGVARTFQNLELVESSTVLENVLLGATQYVRWGFLRGLAPPSSGLGGERPLREIAARALRMVDLQSWAQERAANLPYGLRRHVELARAIAAGPRLLLLDEPSAGMDPTETAQLGTMIARLVDRLGITVLLVEHDMALVRPFADHVHVLHQGRLLLSGHPGDVLTDPEVRRIYLGSTKADHA